MKQRRLQEEVDKKPDKPREEGFGDVSLLRLSVPRLLYDLAVDRNPLAL